jgi:hypothetical protein
MVLIILPHTILYVEVPAEAIAIVPVSVIPSVTLMVTAIDETNVADTIAVEQSVIRGLSAT